MTQERAVGPTKAAARPDTADFERFFRTNYLALARMMSLLTPDPDDAVQEAFLQAHRHWDRVSTYENPLAWVRLVAVQRGRNIHRGRLRRLEAVDRLHRHRTVGGDEPSRSWRSRRER